MARFRTIYFRKHPGADFRKEYCDLLCHFLCHSLASQRSSRPVVSVEIPHFRLICTPSAYLLHVRAEVAQADGLRRPSPIRARPSDSFTLRFASRLRYKLRYKIMAKPW